MIANRVELILRRRLCKVFIAADYVMVSFRRMAKIKTPAGSWTEIPVDPPLPPQKVRIIPSKRRYGTPFENTEAGRITSWPYLMMGPHDMDIAEEDVFEWNGATYVVKSIEPRREERTIAAIDFRGVPDGFLSP